MAALLRGSPFLCFAFANIALNMTLLSKRLSIFAVGWGNLSKDILDI